AWLTLDEDDADPRRLMTYLLAALESCGITNSGLSAAWRSGMQATVPQAAASALLNFLHQQRDPTFLFLDDCHKLPHGEAAAALLAFIFGRLPASLRFAIAGRGSVPFSLGVLRSRGRIAEIDSD